MTDVSDGRLILHDGPSNDFNDSELQRWPDTTAVAVHCQFDASESPIFQFATAPRLGYSLTNGLIELPVESDLYAPNE